MIKRYALRMRQSLLALWFVFFALRLVAASTRDDELLRATHFRNVTLVANDPISSASATRRATSGGDAIAQQTETSQVTLQASARTSAPTSNGAPTEGSTMILVYPFDGCRGSSSEGTVTAHHNAHDLELQSPRRARDVALSELERRVNEMAAARDGNAARRLGEEHFAGTSLRLKSRYLSALQMEIATIPPMFTKEDMTQLSEGLPCVDMVSEDYIKTIRDPEDPQTVLSWNSFDISDNERHQERQLYQHKVTEAVMPSRFGFSGFDRLLFGRKWFQTATAKAQPERRASEIYSNQEQPRQTPSLRGAEFGGAGVEGDTPDDDLFHQQWHLLDSVPWSIGVQSTWKDWRGMHTPMQCDMYMTTPGSPSMVVAIIDSGCDLDHPDLKSKLWRNSGEICGDGIDNDQNGYVDDCYGWVRPLEMPHDTMFSQDWVDNDNSPYPEGSGHGTAAAGIIAAETNNMRGVASICWECRIMCLRFIEGVEGRVSNQVSAIDYAAKMGAKISNNSYGGYGFSKLEFEVIKRVQAYGHLFVASAGNNDHDTDLPQLRNMILYDHTPSIYDLDNILAVGASTVAGRKATFSNYGKESVDVFAPGSRIVTTENGGGYASVSGTSFAAPMGVGAAALIWSRFPSLSYLDVINVIKSSCKTSSDLQGLAVCSGVVNVAKAMAAAATYASSKGNRGDTPRTLPSINHQPASPSSRVQPAVRPATDLVPSGHIGYTGWLGAFLAGFSKSLGRGGTSALEMSATSPTDTPTWTVSSLVPSERDDDASDSDVHLKDAARDGSPLSSSLRAELPLQKTQLESPLAQNNDMRLFQNESAKPKLQNTTAQVTSATGSVAWTIRETAIRNRTARLPSSYLLFSGTTPEGTAISLDPLYLSDPEFEGLVLPYEIALGLRSSDRLKNHDVSVENVIDHVAPPTTLRNSQQSLLPRGPSPTTPEHSQSSQPLALPASAQRLEQVLRTFLPGRSAGMASLFGTVSSPAV